MTAAAGGTTPQLIISEVVDATLPGGLPKFVELTNTGSTTLDLSGFSIGNYSNGSTTLGGGSTTVLSGLLAPCDSYVISYESSDSPGVGSFFDNYGFDPDNFDLGAFINGDDAIALFIADGDPTSGGEATGDGSDATLLDVYGVIGTDGTGEAWEYIDSWASRIGTSPSATFNAADWTIAGANSLEGTCAGDDVCELANLLANTTPGAHPCTVPAAGAPVNDDCANATSVGYGITAFDATTAGDSGILMTGATCGVSTELFADVWYCFTPGASGSYDIEVVDNGSGGYDTKLALYGVTTCPADVLDLVDCDDDGGVGTLSALTVTLNAGQTYLIRIGSFSSFTSEVPAGLSIQGTPPPPPAPANDDCANASALALGSNIFDQSFATDSPDPLAVGCGITTIFQDVWFTFTAGTTGTYDFESFNAGFGNTDTKFALYSATTCPADALDNVTCDDDGGSTAFHSKVSTAMTAGASVLLRVGTFSATSPTFPTDLVVTFVPPMPPANDDCVNAAAISPGLTAFDTSLATTDGVALDPGVCDMGAAGDEQIYNDVWYCFNAPTTEDYNVTTFGLAGFDTRLAVYDNGCGLDDPALVVACNDDFAGFPFEAGLSFSATAGTSYKIRLGGYGPTDADAGDLLIEVSNPPMPPANDDCANAAAIAPGLTAFDTSLASTDGVALDDMVCDMGMFGDEQIYNDVWYCFNAPGDKTYIVTTFGLAGFDTRLAVYDNGCGLDDPALVVACNDDFDGSFPFEAGLSFSATAGTSYKIRLGGYGPSTAGAGDLEIIEVPNVVSFCYGDGDINSRPCKCGNDDVLNPATGGCLNSSGTGAVLTSNGDSSVGSNALTFDLSGGVPSALAVLTSGDNALGGGIGILGLPESDGLRCVGVNFLRHGSRALDASGSTANSFGSFAGPVAGIIGQAGFTAGQTRYFQVRYRDFTSGPCGFGTNTSQAIAVTFKP